MASSNLTAQSPWPRTDASISAVSPRAFEASAMAPASISAAARGFPQFCMRIRVGRQRATHPQDSPHGPCTRPSSPGYSRQRIVHLDRPPWREESSHCGCRCPSPPRAAATYRARASAGAGVRGRGRGRGRESLHPADGPRCFGTVVSARGCDVPGDSLSAVSSGFPGPAIVDQGAWAASADMRSHAGEHPPGFALGLGALDLLGCWRCLRRAADSSPSSHTWSACCATCAGPCVSPSCSRSWSASNWRSRAWWLSARPSGENGLSVVPTCTPWAAAATGQPLARSARSGGGSLADPPCKLKPGRPMRARCLSPPAVVCWCCCWYWCWCWYWYCCCVRCVSTDARSRSSGFPPATCCRSCPCATSIRDEDRRTPRGCSLVHGRASGSSILCCHVDWLTAPLRQPADQPARQTNRQAGRQADGETESASGIQMRMSGSVLDRRRGGAPPPALGHCFPARLPHHSTARPRRPGSLRAGSVEASVQPQTRGGLARVKQHRASRSAHALPRGLGGTTV